MFAGLRDAVFVFIGEWRPLHLSGFEPADAVGNLLNFPASGEVFSRLFLEFCPTFGGHFGVVFVAKAGEVAVYLDSVQCFAHWFALSVLRVSRSQLSPSPVTVTTV